MLGDLRSELALEWCDANECRIFFNKLQKRQENKTCSHFSVFIMHIFEQDEHKMCLL